jgi:type I restriction enzyme S subunit
MIDSALAQALPKGWDRVSLANCCSRITDGTHLPPKFTPQGIPFIFVQHIVGGAIRFEKTKFISAQTHAQLNSRCPVEQGDILYSAVGSYGVAVLVNTDAPFSFQRHIAHIKPLPGISSKFLVHCLNSPSCLSQAHKVARGVAQKTVTLGDLKQFTIPIAPACEQRRVVQKIEELFSKLDAGVAALERVKANLKRYRAAVLKAAVEGKLTAEWRARHPDTEPASLHSKHSEVRTGTRKRAGRLWGSGVVPELTDEEKSLLPSGWRWAKVRDLGNDPEETVQVGPMSMRSKDFTSSGIPVLNVGCVQWDRFEERKLDYLPREKAEQFARYGMKPGDVLFTRSGTVGRCAVVQGYQKGWLMTFHLLRVRVDPDRCLPTYLRIVFEGAGHIRRQTRSASVGTTRAGFNTNLLAFLDVPLPPFSEQEQIVDEVERRLSIVDDLEAEVEGDLKRAGRLRQSILKRAFAGKLVPQYPNDEPAAKLLERIRASRSNEKRLAKTVRRPETVASQREGVK